MELDTRLRLCIETKPPPAGIVIFGASGDLARAKLIPSLFSLFRRGLLPEKFFILGCARTPYTEESYREEISSGLGRESEEDKRAAFVKRIHYIQARYADPGFYTALTAHVLELNCRYDCPGNLLFYLAVPPFLYETIVSHLGRSGLTRQNGDNRAWRRVVVEKPFGNDLASARALDRALHEVLGEDQLYRIDHYLGKETVQNIFMFRFANLLFEPVWNRQYVDHVQVTVAESVGVGKRSGYFDASGQLRDMFQNHLLMVTSLVAMEPPGTFEADSVRNEVVKLLQAIRPFPREELGSWVVRGQYTSGTIGGRPVRGYRKEPGVRPDSTTETFVAAKLLIDNWRWNGTPFYLRTGKRLPRKLSEVVIRFKPVPHSIFKPLLPGDLNPNQLVLTIQPDEGVSLTLQAKQPGAKLCVGDLTLHFNYAEAFGGEVPDAYERLLLDALVGDQTLFIRNDAIEVAWALVTPCLEAWERDEPSAGALHTYPAGSWGPEAADELIRKDGRTWRTSGV